MMTTDQGTKFSEISFPELQQIIQSDKMLVIDVREPHEVAEAHVTAKTFINIPLKELESSFNKSPEEFRQLYKFEKPGKSDEIAFICRSGRRTKLALAEMLNLGYSRSSHFDGGTLRLLRDHPEIVEKKEDESTMS